MDDLDKEILYILQENSKITNSQIAKEIGLSPSSTLERVRRLESSGIIKGYSLILDKEKLGLNCSFLVYINLVSLQKEIVDSFIENINEIPEVIEINKISGKADFILKVLCNQVSDFNVLLKEVFSEIEEIKSIKSEIILETIKTGEILPISSKEIIEYV